jgi:hypothetical protein
VGGHFSVEATVMIAPASFWLGLFLSPIGDAPE